MRDFGLRILDFKVIRKVNPVRISSPAMAGLEAERDIKARRNYLKCNPAAEKRGIISNGVN